MVRNYVWTYIFWTVFQEVRISRIATVISMRIADTIACLLVQTQENYKKCKLYRVVQKTDTLVLYALISSNIDRFSNLFHCQNQKKICNSTVAKDPTTPQVCRYTTLWNVSVLTATIENETTFVTTHFKSASYGSKVDTLNIWTITAGCVSYSSFR